LPRGSPSPSSLDRSSLDRRGHGKLMVDHACHIQRPFAVDRELEGADPPVEDLRCRPVVLEVEAVRNVDLNFVLPRTEQIRIEVKSNRRLAVEILDVPTGL